MSPKNPRMFRTSVAAEPDPVEEVDREAPDPQSAFARQAIVDADRNVFGYELLHRNRPGDIHTFAIDTALLLHAGGRGAPSGDAAVFLNCTHDMPWAGRFDLIDPARVVLQVPPLPLQLLPDMPARTRALADLQRRGFRLAVNHTALTPAYAAWLPLASFIKLDLLSLEHSVFERFACAAQTYSAARLIAEKVETAQQFDQVVAYGIDLFQGGWLGTPERLRLGRAG